MSYCIKSNLNTLIFVCLCLLVLGEVSSARRGKANYIFMFIYMIVKKNSNSFVGNMLYC